jgi:hypothetical protein
MHGLGLGNQGHGTLWVSLDSAKRSLFLAEFIDAPASSGKSALWLYSSQGQN